MKELSIEEKARAYDEVREKIAIRFGSNVADEIFSQFEMSEDERIRKELLNYLYDVHDDDEDRARWIAWLEKQCKNNMGISEATKQELEDNLNKALEKETPESLNEFLEEQDDQKSVKWTEEDEMHIRELESLVKQVWAIAEHENDKETIHKMSDLSFFLKTLKPQLKQEWCEEKPTQEIEPFEAEHGKYYYCIKDYFCGGRKQTSKGDVVQALRGLPIMGLKDASEYFLPVNFIKCNSAWNEKDEYYYTKLEHFLDVRSHYEGKSQYQEEVKETLNWLKSLRTQLQWKPSEEDCNRISSIKYLLHELDNYNFDNWLDSLRPQSTWKPSDEEMKALADALSLANNCGEESAFDLRTLYKQLKKLREE